MGAEKLNRFRNTFAQKGSIHLETVPMGNKQWNSNYVLGPEVEWAAAKAGRTPRPCPCPLPKLLSTMGLHHLLVIVTFDCYCWFTCHSLLIRYKLLRQTTAWACLAECSAPSSLAVTVYTLSKRWRMKCMAMWSQCINSDSTATESLLHADTPLDDEDTAVSTTERNKKILLTPWALASIVGEQGRQTIKAVSEEVGWLLGIARGWE